MSNIQKTGNYNGAASCELLSPAGDFASLEAAVCAGADAVYFGTQSYNARMNAANFTYDEITRACALCHAGGVKAYVTLNTQLYDREIADSGSIRIHGEFLKRVETLYNLGVDALIVADVGAAAIIHYAFPDFPIHASTQMSGHGVLSADFHQRLGFTRMICARELSKPDVQSLVKNSKIETEMFIHGAHCVSYSGQCFMSWAMGGRSGNRGECAQPCRLPYYCQNSKSQYALSLKDLNLAAHITDLLEAGVSSLKIEGRMKNPSYVYGVTKIYRTLIDERRNAEPDEIAALAAYFSRCGFTDGYFTEKTNASMLGIRSESDKEVSRNVSVFAEKIKKVPVEIHAVIKKDTPAAVTMKSRFGEVRVSGDVPAEAINVPLSEDDVVKCMAKLGQTPFCSDKITVDIDENLILKVSQLNSLRRAACEKMIEPSRGLHYHTDGEILINPDKIYSENNRKKKFKDKINTAEFTSVVQITEEAEKYFSLRFIPIEKLDGITNKNAIKFNGISLPPVIFDSEIPLIEKMLNTAKKMGINDVLVSNSGHIELARRNGFTQMHGSFRLNVFNSFTAEVYGMEEMTSYTLSPELILPQMRDIGSTNENMIKSVIIYGKLPLMYVQRCIINNGKADGTGICGGDFTKCTSALTDRTGAKLCVYGSFGHRNLIYNSVPIYMADQQEQAEISGAGMYHYIFSSERPHDVDKIIDSYKNKLPSDDKIKRISNRIGN